MKNVVLKKGLLIALIVLVVALVIGLMNAYAISSFISAKIALSEAESVFLYLVIIAFSLDATALGIICSYVVFFIAKTEAKKEESLRDTKKIEEV